MSWCVARTETNTLEQAGALLLSNTVEIQSYTILSKPQCNIGVKLKQILPRPYLASNAGKYTRCKDSRRSDESLIRANHITSVTERVLPRVLGCSSCTAPVMYPNAAPTRINHRWCGSTSVPQKRLRKKHLQYVYFNVFLLDNERLQIFANKEKASNAETCST